MNAIWIVVFAAIAAVGNAMFALGQKLSVGMRSGLLFVAASTLVACVYGTSAYAVYASMAILTTTVGVGFLYLKETANRYHISAVLFAVGAIILFSLGSQGDMHDK